MRRVARGGEGRAGREQQPHLRCDEATSSCDASLEEARDALAESSSPIFVVTRRHPHATRRSRRRGVTNDLAAARDGRDEAPVEDAEPPVARAQQVARVRVGVEHARLLEHHREVRVHRDRAEPRHVRRVRAVEPLAVDPAVADVCRYSWWFREAIRMCHVILPNLGVDPARDGRVPSLVVVQGGNPYVTRPSEPRRRPSA